MILLRNKVQSLISKNHVEVKLALGQLQNDFLWEEGMNLVRLKNVKIGRVVYNENRAVTQSDLDHLVSWDQSNKVSFNTIKMQTHTHQSKEYKPYLQNRLLYPKAVLFKGFRSLNGQNSTSAPSVRQ